MKALRLPVLMLLLLSAAVVSAAEVKISGDGRKAKVEVRNELPQKATFKADELFGHAEFLANDECNGRLAGSPGQAVARDYVLKRLKKAGFDNVRQLPFEFISGVSLGTNNRLGAKFSEAAAKQVKPDAWFRKPESDGAVNYKIDDDFRPFRMSKAGEFSGGVVFAGYGISAPDKNYDDYANLDVKGKVVLLFRGEPETSDNKRIGMDKPDPHAAPGVFGDLFYKAAVARDKGAVAIIAVTGKRGTSDAERASLENFQRGGGRTDCGIPLLQVFPEVAGDWLHAAGRDFAALQKQIDDNLKPQSLALEGVTVTARIDVVRDRAIDENIVAVIPGSDPVLKDEIVVIGAHYDHLGLGNEFSLADKTEMGRIHRGADDNASGTASVLEVAAALNKNRKALKRTVWIMFFGAEELGTLGSLHFTKEPPADFKLDKTAAMLNLDMVGRCRQRKVMVYGASTGTGFEEVLRRANDGLELDIKTTADGFGGSDQTAFVNSKVPVLFFFTGSHEDYHKPSDTADKLNVADQARISALVYRTAVDLINADKRPAFVNVEVPKMSSGMGGVGLGTLPDYAFEGKGLRLSGVRSGSPADKAGIKMGDIILRLGAHKIENIYDYMNALKQSQAGIEIKAVISREGKELEIPVTPEKR